LGYLNALAIAASPLTLTEKLKWHRLDFSTKLPENIVNTWEQAIRLFDLGLAESTLVELPAGATYLGGKQVSIGNLIMNFNLEYFTQAFADELPRSPLDVPLECEKTKLLR